MGWQYNALKTMRYWHENLWRDGEVRALHYIVDKPWERRIASDGVAGHLGRDGDNTWLVVGCLGGVESEKGNGGGASADC